MPSKKLARFTGNRTAAIGLIVVCIVGTAILIAARSSEPTSATAATPQNTVAAAAAKPVPTVRTQVVSAKTATKTAAKPQAGEAAKEAEHVAEPATIEGCLVQDDETFQLKNTAGENAPKGRSWKSGFLKKSSKTIEIVDARHRMNLAGHVGERVSVSGMLDDREMQGTSLKRIAESCK
jgi:hypothetical protein